jgi:hypothetical protein
MPDKNINSEIDFSIFVKKAINPAISTFIFLISFDELFIL